MLLPLLLIAGPALGVASAAADIGLSGQQASDIAFGVAEAFLNGTRLVHGEAKCLLDSASHLAGDVTDIYSDMVEVMRHFLQVRSPAPATSAPASSPAGAASSPTVWHNERVLQEVAEPAAPATVYFGSSVAGSLITTTPVPIPQGSHLGSTMAVMEIAEKLYASLRIETRLAETCLHRDAVQALQVAALHLKNLTYVGSSIFANGAEILAELSYAVVAWDKEDYLGYGMALGNAARKTLSANGIAHAAAGSISPLALEKMAEGLVDGLFPKGATLGVSANGTPAGAALAVLSVDLRQCVLGNANYFRVAWASAWGLLQALAAEASQSEASEVVADGDFWADPLDSSSVLEMARVLIAMPEALRLCNVTHEQEETLLDSLWVGQALRFNYDAPESRQHLDELVSFATKAWAAGRWHELGVRLGEMLLEMLQLSFPKKYGASEPVVMSWSRPSLSMVAPCFVVLSLFALAIAGGRRLLRSTRAGPLSHHALTLARNPQDYDSEEAVE